MFTQDQKKSPAKTGDSENTMNDQVMCEEDDIRQAMASPTHGFNSGLAELYGIEESILIHHFQHWISYNQQLKRNFREGRTWTYQTGEEIAAHFPYFSADQVRRVINSLIEKGVIVKGNFNRTKMDRTCWYAFKNEQMFTKWRNRQMQAEEPHSSEKPPEFSNSVYEMAKSPNGQAKSRNGDREIAKAIPHTPPDPVSKIHKNNILVEHPPKEEVVLSSHDDRKKMPEVRHPEKLLAKLTTEQRTVHDDIVAHAPAHGQCVPSETICAWFLAKHYSVDQVQQAFNVYKQDSKDKEATEEPIRSMGAYITSALQQKRTARHSSFEENKKHAELIKKNRGASWLTVLKDYVRIEFGADSECVPFSLPLPSFVDALGSLLRKAEILNA